jgi:hypothetical protein
MYLAVDLREDAEEGPEALEIASEQPVDPRAARGIPGVRVVLVSAPGTSPSPAPPALGG